MVARKTDLSEHLKDALDRYKKVLMDDPSLGVEEVYVFGSHVVGGVRQDSDLDVAVVSRKFARDRHDGLIRLMKMRRGISYYIEPHPLSPEDLENPYHPLGSEVARYGVRVL